MKTLMFDTGPVISLTTNNLLQILRPLKEWFDGEFYITETVKKELIERPLQTKKFKFEALQVMHLLDQGVIKVYKDHEIDDLTNKLLDLANNSFFIKGRAITVVHHAEMEVLAAMIKLGSSAVVIDERTTRLLAEDPSRLAHLLKRKFRSGVRVKKENLKKFHTLLKGLKIIRSVELVTIAYEKGLLDDYLTGLPEAHKTLLESVLWGVKLHGCSVSHLEIDKIVKLEARRRKDPSTT